MFRFGSVFGQTETEIPVIAKRETATKPLNLVLIIVGSVCSLVNFGFFFGYNRINWGLGPNKV